MNGQLPTIIMPPPGFSRRSHCSGDSVKKGSMFCKLVVPSTLEEGEQEVPAKFVNALQGPITHLSLPNGHYWRVKLRKEGNKLWFHGGWLEYLQVLSVRVGFLLLFEYQGESTFEVFVYDLRTCQINVLHHMMSDASAGSEHACCPGLTLPSFLRDQVFDEYADQKPFSQSQNWPLSNMHLAHNACSSQATAQLDGHEFNKFTRRWRDVSEEEKKRAVYASEMFDSVYPFFKVTLKPSYVYRGYSLHIPAKFAKEHLRGVPEFITLVFEGRQWPVKMASGGGGTRLTKGWPDFAWHTHLEVDDVCLFELISTSHVVFMVTIFRVLQLAQPILQTPLAITNGS